MRCTRNVGPDLIRSALEKHEGCRSFAATELNIRIDTFRAAIKRAEGMGYRFPKAPSTRIVTKDEVYMPSPEAIRAACEEYQRSWSYAEERSRRTFFHDGTGITLDYEIPTGMSFRTLDGRAR